MLYLLPNLLFDAPSHTPYLPSSVDEVVSRLTHLIVENEKEGRKFLKRFIKTDHFRSIVLHPLNEHTTLKQKQELISEIKKGGVFGLISDCGMPCLADPGADLVLMAREAEIPIEAFAGPSSILLGLVLSGLGGQRFTFHGYLPREEAPLVQTLRSMEACSKKEDSTHLFIETPYRNEKMYHTLLSTLHKSTYLCLAIDLTSTHQEVITQRIEQWQKGKKIELAKRAALFLIKSR